MNPEHPSNPREELELRVTSLLLGELSEAEAALVRDAIANDPELQKLHDDLKQTIHLLREATVSVGEPVPEESDAPKLSEEKRQQLLTAFVIPAMKPEHVKQKPRARFTLIELLAVVAIVGVLAAISFPGMRNFRSATKSAQVVNNLRLLDSAKQQWALEHNELRSDAAPTLEELKPYLGRGADDLLPTVAGEKYVVGKMNEPVAADMDDKQAKQMARVQGVVAPAKGARGTVYLSDNGGLSYAAKAAAPSTDAGAALGVAVTSGGVGGRENLFSMSDDSFGRTKPRVVVSTNFMPASDWVNDSKPWTTSASMRGFYDDNYSSKTPAIIDQNRGLVSSSTWGSSSGELHTPPPAISDGNIGVADNTRVQVSGQVAEATNGAFVSWMQVHQTELESANSSPANPNQKQAGFADRSVKTLPAEPKLAPPPTEIVLPKSGSADGGSVQLADNSGVRASNDFFNSGERAGGGAEDFRFSTDKNQNSRFDAHGDDQWNFPNMRSGTVGTLGNVASVGALETTRDRVDVAGSAVEGELAVRKPAAPQKDTPGPAANPQGFVPGTSLVVQDAQKVPVLGDVPSVGRLFRSERNFGPASEEVTIDGKKYKREFVGYDDAGGFAPQAQSGSGGSNAGLPITASLPMPHYRLKEVEVASEPATAVPSWQREFGFNTSGSATADPAGNRVHTDEPLPFAGKSTLADSITANSTATASPQKDIHDPAVSTLTGILTDPQFKVVEKALAARASGSNNDQKALGFDWYQGHTLEGKKGVTLQGGTAPSYSGTPTAANPNGFLPGTSLANTIPSAASDQLLTSGLRNTAQATTLGDSPVLGANSYSDARTPARESGAIPANGTKSQTAAQSAVQTAKLLYENGRYDEAEVQLKEALNAEPGNYPAAYYSSLIKEKRDANATMRRAIESKERIAQVEKAWEMPTSRERLPVPNPYAHTNLVGTSQDRQAILNKLDRIRLNSVQYDGLPLSEVVRNLSEESKRSDPDKKGINFTIAPGAESVVAGTTIAKGIDPTSGLPAVGDTNLPPSSDLSDASVKMYSPVSNVKLQNLLEIVAKSADRPLKYSIEENGIVFSPREAEKTPLYTRTFKVDPNSFWQGLQNVEGISFGSSNGQNAVVPRVSVAGGGMGGGGTVQNSGGSLSFITQQQTVASIQSATRDFFKSVGVDLDASGKSVFFNDRQGTLFARGTLQDLDAIEQAVQVVNTIPPQVNIRAKFADVGQATKDEQRDKLADAKRDLDNLVSFQKVLEQRLAMEKVDVTLPRTGMVTIMNPAKAPPAADPGILGRIGHAFKGDYVAKASVKIDRANADIAEFTSRGMSGIYDPYFIQTEFEAVKSETVLTNVIARLDLNTRWGTNRSGGRTLKTSETLDLLRSRLDLRPVKNTMFIEIGVKSSKPDEAAELANAVAEAYREHRLQEIRHASEGGVRILENRFEEQQKKVAQAQQKVNALREKLVVTEPAPVMDAPLPRKPSTNAPIPQPEILTSENNFSTFSLNVSDVSFKLAAASLEKGQMPDSASIRSEEFINAFDYRDPEPSVPLQGGDRGGFSPVAFAWERARYPFAHNRDLLRFSLKTAAAGRQAGRPLNVVLLLDNSGSMERADRVGIIREALRVLASQLQPQDKLSVITFARTPRLIADGIAGDKAGEVAEQVSGLTPEGGTNLEDAMNLAYQTAAKHFLVNGINRVVLLTDGAANLGNVEPESLKQKVETHRKQGIALDCFGIGWEGFNDDLLEVLSRNGDGRYGFINSPEEAATEFAGQLAGALKVAASDVKVQVEFNPKRVTSYRQIGYAKHQLTKEQFRDNTVDAAEIAAQEAGNALYTVEVNPAGEGPLCTVHVRYKIPGTSDYREQAWEVPFSGNATAVEQASAAMRLATSASAFSEWLAVSPHAGEVQPDALLNILGGVPEAFGADSRPKKLEWMIRQAKSLEGK